MFAHTKTELTCMELHNSFCGICVRVLNVWKLGIFIYSIIHLNIKISNAHQVTIDMEMLKCTKHFFFLNAGRASEMVVQWWG